MITLAAVVAYSAYVTRQIAGLRQLQNNLIDRNRKDSLQLLRIQNELNSVGISMRDMLDTGTLDPLQRHPLTAWQPQFERMRVDLEDAFRREQQVSPEGRTEGQQRYLLSSLAQFWNGVDQTFNLARHGQEKQAQEQVRMALQNQLAALTTASWCKTTKARNERRPKSRKSTIGWRGKHTFF